MTELASTDFGEFFTALWGHEPFAWQTKLATEVLAGSGTSWPQAIALPTAAGKTACMDVAVFALAAQASRYEQGKTVTAPRRIFFAVDRRVIVDEAFERAKSMASVLSRAEDGILRTVAQALRVVAHGGTPGAEEEVPLTVHTLRGGTYRSESWARTPLQPAIIATTVDQIGSRLLFRAYGRGSGMWPVYAGLAANDSLIFLDEAHCARPFLQTLQAVKQYQAWGERPLGRTFQPVVLSATPPSGLQTFVDSSDEARDPGHPLGRRQLARKVATLSVANDAKGKRGFEHLAKALAESAEKLADNRGRAVAVFANRVATARTAWRLLKKKHGDRAVLLTGRMRAVDKDEVVNRNLKALASAASSTRQLDKPVFVVATQTLEVGADLDFDALVTECASLDALRQRFGRLNRMGRPIEAKACIVVRGDQAESSDDDPVYGAALSSTWAWLKAEEDELGAVDFGISSLAARLPEGEALDALNAPSTDAPVMLPSHVDCWVQTAPQPAPSPDVALFLHGPDRGVADVQVCWRTDLDLDALGLCPPSSGETLPVPLAVFRRWLSGDTSEDSSSDVEGTAGDAEPAGSSRPAAGTIKVVRWRGAGTASEDLTDDPDAVLPGDTVVLPADAQGSLKLGDLPAAEGGAPAQLDVGDRAYLAARAKPILRINRELVACWPGEAAKRYALSLLEQEEDEPAQTLDLVRRMLEALMRETEGVEGWEWLNTASDRLLREARRKTFIRNIRRTEAGNLVITGQNLVPELIRQAETFSDEDDTLSSGMTDRQGCAVALLEHLKGVEEFSRRYAAGCGLPDRMIEAVAAAGLLHDTGKADMRFQALLQAGSPLAAFGCLYAKSGSIPRTRSAFEVARKASGYPPGGRHELLSARLGESSTTLPVSDPVLRDLVLHLVSSHHGHCRPFAPVVHDHGAPEVAFDLDGLHLSWSGPTKMEALESGTAARFWRLTRRFGWWGLAWLEAIMRLADHRRSEWEANHAGGVHHE